MSTSMDAQDQAPRSEPLIDTLTRAAAGGAISRRGALRSVFVALAGVAIDSIRAKGAWAASASTVAATADCFGASFDSTTQCCVSAGVVGSRSDNPSVLTCPDRIARPGYVPGGNGCGAEDGGKFPDFFGEADFFQSCWDHDVCYGTCNSDKVSCDGTFAQQLSAACAAAYPITTSPLSRFACDKVADKYLTAVYLGGKEAWAQGQVGGCDCCAQGTPCPGATPLCGNQCIGPGEHCCDGVPKPISQPCDCTADRPVDCGSVCCPLGQVCSPDKVCVPDLNCPADCPAWRCCGGWCCPEPASGSGIVLCCDGNTCCDGGTMRCIPGACTSL